MPRIKKTPIKKEDFVAEGRNANCTRCSLHKTSVSGDKALVCLFGDPWEKVLNQSVKIMLVGEAPGREEILKETPFSGAAGALLDKYLSLAGLSRAEIYITNTVKCRPPDNRAPKPMEIKACAPYLDYEIGLAKPAVIGVLGATALKRVTGLEGISKLRGKPIWSEKYKCWCVPTWHPSYVLRNGESIEEAEQFRRDLEFIKRIAETGDTGQIKTEYTVIDSIELFRGMMCSLRMSSITAVDTETWGDYITGNIISVQFSIKAGTAFFVPFYKTGIQYDKPTDKFWSDEDEKIIWAELKEYLENPDRHKGGQNIKYDWQFFTLYGIELKGVVFDTMLGHYLLDENAVGQHDLGTMALKYTDMGDYSNELYQAMGIEASKVDGFTFIKAPFDSLCKYACKDADATFRLICRFYNRVKQEGEMPLLQKLMIPLSFVLAKMEMEGVLVDVDYYKALALDYRKKIKELEDELVSFPDVQWLERQQGKPVNFNSPDQMRKLFYDILKLPVYKMTKSKKRKTKEDSKASTDKEVLGRLSELHPIPKFLLKHRKLSKFVGTYVEPIPDLIKSDGRLHTTYAQHITVTGRLSSSKPNLQNIPKREPELAAQIRHGIIAPPGHKILESDEGQIEFRLWANESQDPVMLADLRDAKIDIHKKIASIAFRMSVEQVTKEIREKAKTIVYSVVYGKSEENLAKETGLTVEQVKAVFNAIFTRYPVGKAWMDRTAKRAETTGEVVNWIGRKRRLSNGFKSGVEPLIAEARRQAINSPIQGGAHDILSVCTLRVQTELDKRNLKARLVMTIHDALVLYVPDEELKEVAILVKECMERPIARITVPLIADLAVGDRLSTTVKLEKEYFTNVEA